MKVLTLLVGLLVLISFIQLVYAFDYPETSPTEPNFPINLTILETIGTYTNPVTNDSGNFTHYLIGLEIFLENYSVEMEEYFYDPFGQRIKITRNDTDNTTIYTPFKELMRIRNSTGSYDFTYVYQEGILVARVNPDGSKYFYHPDHLGSTTLITDENGNVVENTYYSPYGELLGGGSGDVILYTGQFKDITNQYYYGCRYYKTGTAQFIQPDPFIKNVYHPQSLNRYAYAFNNPYRNTDPTGCIVKELLAFTGITILTIQLQTILSQIIAQISAEAMTTSYVAATTTVGAEETVGTSIQTTGGVGTSTSSKDIMNQPSPEQKIKETIESSTQGITQASNKGSGSTTSGTRDMPADFKRTYGSKTNNELQKSIRSLEKQIRIHQDKIASPSKYDKGWDAKTEIQKQGLLNKWQKEINNFKNQIQTLGKILTERGVIP